MSGKLSFRLGRFLSASLISMFLVTPGLSSAQGGPAETVAAGAAVAGVVLTAVQGLATWVDSQSNDCYVAALGAAWGKDCNLKKNEEQDTGWYNAYVSVDGENDCAHGWGQGLAQEGFWGSWEHQLIKPKALAWTKALHAGTAKDKHNAKGWAKAGVDGHAKATEDATPDSAAGGRQAPLDEGTSSPPDTTGDWTPGSFIAIAYIDSLQLSAASLGVTSTSFRTSLRIDGVEVWGGTASLDGSGSVVLGGDLAGASYTLSYDPATSLWNFLLLDYRFEYLIGVLGGTASLMDGASEIEADINMEAEVSADASLEGPGSEYYTTVTSFDVHSNDSGGVPVLDGQAVELAVPVTTVCSPDLFGSVMADLHLRDPQTGLGIGVIDFQPIHPFPAGQQALIRGIVTHHEGRTVLIDPEIVAMSLTSAPPPQSLQLSQFYAEPERWENGLLRIIEEVEYVGNTPISEGTVRWCVPSTGNEIETYLDPDAGPWPTIQPGMRTTITGLAMQFDPEPSHGSNVISSKASDETSGYFGGYYLRPRSGGDLGLETSSSGEELDQNRPAPLFELAQNWPNPFSPATQITFRLTDEADVRLQVFSVNGELVRTLVDGAQKAGRHEVGWNGRDESDNPVAAGIYFYTLEAGSLRQARKMIVVR